MRIVFMGTPEFAVPSLERLLETGNEIAGVFTQPDKPKGRRGILSAPAIKEFALGKGLTVRQPATLKDGSALEYIGNAAPELIVVVAYGKILPAEILDFPKLGCINIHASLLPKLRGAAPVQRSIMNGFTKTGVTSMFMDEGVDTGDILLQSEVEIGENETAGELGERLSALGAETLERTVKALERGELKPVKQNEEERTYAPAISKEESPVDWNLSAREIHNRVRGLFPRPSASARINGKRVKILRTAPIGGKGGRAGEIEEAGKRLVVSCGGGSLIEILEIQAESRRAAPAADFLRGVPLKKGGRFE